MKILSILLVFNMFFIVACEKKSTTSQTSQNEEKFSSIENNSPLFPGEENIFIPSECEQ